MGTVCFLPMPRPLTTGPSREGEGFAQHAASARYFAFFDQLADGSAADPFASARDGSGGHDFKAKPAFRPSSTQCVYVACLFMARSGNRHLQ